MPSRAITAVPLAIAIAWTGTLPPSHADAASPGYPPPPGPYRSGPVAPPPVATSAEATENPTAVDTRPGMLLPETQPLSTDSEYGAANLFGATSAPRPPADVAPTPSAVPVSPPPIMEPAPPPRGDFSMDFRRAPGPPGRFGGPAMPNPADRGPSPRLNPGYDPAPGVNASPPFAAQTAPPPPRRDSADRAPYAVGPEADAPVSQAAAPRYGPVPGGTASAGSPPQDGDHDGGMGRVPGGPMFRPPDVTAD